ncbi:MAG: CHAD domain-containing protein [Balneolaceae bacterium]|nr:CHAD domain-containing protein [Balneolaceae bacterium]
MISNLDDKSTNDLNKRILAIFEISSGEIKDLAMAAPGNMVESVHLIRKRLKFLRAFVKLTRFCADEESYKPVNYMLRDSGRLFSDCRDAHVRQLLLEEFNQIKSTRHFVDELARLNKQGAQKIEESLLSDSSAFDKLISDISNNEISGYFKSLNPNPGCLAEGLGLGYEKSYHAFHSELESHDADLLHEWRKRTKDLQYQLEALLDSLTDPLQTFYKKIVTLCEILGRINDLFMFLEWLDSAEDTIEKTDPLTELKNILNLELKELEDQADTMGDSIFIFTPDEFTQKLMQEIKE